MRDLRRVTAATIDVRLNTPGGNVFEGFAIYNALREHPAHVVSYVDGLAASIGSIIALAGDEVVMAANSHMMIHEGEGIAIGRAGMLRARADALDNVNDALVGIYAERSNLEEDEIRDMMAADETWFSAAEAEEAGLADRVAEDEAVTAILPREGAFKNAPKDLRARRLPPTERAIDRYLRDAGLTRSEAKAVLAEGYGTDDLRDAEPAGALFQRVAAALRGGD